MAENVADIRATARAFIRGAFVELRRDNVIPTSIYNPFVRVGRDYFGDQVRAVSEFHTLEHLLDDGYPERFAHPLGHRDREFASSYVFGLLEACVARCAVAKRFDPDSPEVGASIEEMLTILDTKAYEVVVCRLVAHLTTTTGDEMPIGDVVVVPEEPDRNRPLVRRMDQEIAGAVSVYEDTEHWSYDPPHSLLIARETSEEGSPYGVADRASARLERFLLLTRLLTASTAYSFYEVSGQTTLVARMHPSMRTFEPGGMLSSIVRRTARFTGTEGSTFDALGDLVDSADVKREGMAASPLDVALSKFQLSHTPRNTFEHLVDLGTALEGILLGWESGTEGITFRLRSRAAALLATQADPAAGVYNDVGLLYGLRSTLVHGAEMKLTTLKTKVGRVSTVPPDYTETRFGVAAGYIVDRMRDLVRRAILARICLAAEPDPLWPFGEQIEVDPILADDSERARWRARWHERLAAIGAGDAAGPPRAAVDFLSQEDR